MEISPGNKAQALVVKWFGVKMNSIREDRRFVYINTYGDIYLKFPTLFPINWDYYSIPNVPMTRLETSLLSIEALDNKERSVTLYKKNDFMKITVATKTRKWEYIIIVVREYDRMTYELLSRRYDKEKWTLIRKWDQDTIKTDVLGCIVLHQLREHVLVAETLNEVYKYLSETGVPSLFIKAWGLTVLPETDDC